MNTAHESLSNGTIILRRWQATDGPALQRAVEESLEHIAAWLHFAVGGYTQQDASEFLAKAQADWENQRKWEYAITDSSQTLLGSCSLSQRDNPELMEIGYWLGHQYTGRGIITQAVGLLITEAFRLGAGRIHIKTDVKNLPSQRVAQRWGFYELERKPHHLPPALKTSGEDIVWQLDRR